jgi:hypothetical protein
MTDQRRKRPRDPNQLGKLVMDIATGQSEDRADKRRKRQDQARSSTRAKKSK